MAATKNTSKSERKDLDKPEPKTKTVTVRGVKVTVNPRVMSDVRVTSAMNEAQSGRNPFAIHDAFRRVFGEAYDEVVELIEDEDGIASFEDMNNFFVDVMKKVAPNS